MSDQQTPAERLDTDVLLELILRGYDVAHLEQLPRLHRLQPAGPGSGFTAS